MRKFLLMANRLNGWNRVHAAVTGLDVSGYSAADGLLPLGVRVTILDESDTHADKTAILEILNAAVRLGKGITAGLPGDTDLVVTSPEWRPDTPLLIWALERGIPVWGDVELAWRMQQLDRAIPWLGVTGTSGKTTTTQMVESILQTAGTRAATVGNINRPTVEAILDDGPCDTLVVELSSFQLHWVRTVTLHSAMVLNLHEDHLGLYNGPGECKRYAADKARISERVMNACVYNAVGPETECFVEKAEITEGARAIGFITGIPTISVIDVVGGLIVDRAFVAQRHSSTLELAKVVDVQPYISHNVASAYAAAALVRSPEVPARSVVQGLCDLWFIGYRITEVVEISGVRWIDDSKATSPYAANSAMWAFPSSVRAAGGQTEGTSFDELITTHRDRIRAAILTGVDRQVIVNASSRHAPDAPMITLDSSDHDVMDEVVPHTVRLAREGGAAPLNPGSASLDMPTGYDDHGERSANVIRSLQAPSS